MYTYDHLANTRTGETCVVIGNGPSLKNVPLSFLFKYPTFGTNRIYLLGGFQPTYYVCVNDLVIEQNRAEIERLNSVKFIEEGHDIPDAYLLHTRTHRKFFSRHVSIVHEGWTVTFVCLQLAWLIGFQTILLVGVDHRYKNNGAPNEQTLWTGEDVNHFHPDYFKGQQWNCADLERSEYSYRLARATFDETGRRCVNLTEGTALEVFEKDELANWL